MYISRIRITNVRCFHGPHEVALTLTRPDGTHAGWTVIAGRNGSGKTSLLRAVMLAVAGPILARTLAPGVEDWMSTGSSSAEVAVELAWDADYDRGPQIVWPPEKPVSVNLTWQAVRRDEADVGSRPVFEGHFSDGYSQMDEHPGPWQRDLFGWFAAAYGPFRRLVGGDDGRFADAPLAVTRLTTLFHEDASLASGVRWLINEHLRALEERPGARALRHAALAILGDGLLPGDYRIRDVNSDGLWVHHGGRDFPLREMSDGYRTVSALVVDILRQLHAAYADITLDEDAPYPRISLPGVVVIDEVDAHLHVSWQKRIGTWLTAHFPLIQFIVTTHSPYICQDADEGGLIKLPGHDDPSEAPRVVDRDLYERVVYGTGDDAVLSELFGLDTPFSTEAERLRSELVALEAGILRGDTDEARTARYRELKELLTSSPTTRTIELAARLSEANGTQHE